MPKAKNKKWAEASHVRLYRWLMRTEAWCDLDCFARCAYVELGRRYGGEESETPNGKIPCSVREMAKALNVSVATASRAFTALQDHGLIVLTKRGAFSLKQRHATEWRLTEFPTRGQLATKEFTRWSKKQNAVSPEKPNGVTTENTRCHTGNSTPLKEPSTLSEVIP